MGKIHRKFSLEFKQHVVEEIASGQKSLSQAALRVRNMPTSFRFR